MASLVEKMLPLRFVALERVIQGHFLFFMLGLPRVKLDVLIDSKMSAGGLHMTLTIYLPNVM